MGSEPGDVRRGCKNEHAFQIKLCFLRAAFSKVCTGKMLLEIGAGGDGKGMEAYLDKNLLGEHQTTTLDCGVFLDPQEFRKSGEFACGKCNVRIQGMDSHGRFIADIWKRFVVDKEIDCRVNYGFTYGFTSKRKFGDSMQVQELNYENVPVMEEVRDHLKACEHLKRRLVCLRMGKAQFVTDMDQVDHDKGIYKLLRQDDELIAFLSHPLTASLYFCDWRLPFFCENTMDERLSILRTWVWFMQTLSQIRSLYCCPVPSAIEPVALAMFKTTCSLSQEWSTIN